MNRIYLLLSFLFLTTVSFAQEVCNNGVDDDGDGFIDCYDGECSANNACTGFFLVDNPACQVTPAQFPDFTITLDFSSPNETTNHLSRMAIGDLDRDGVPEIITMNRYTKNVFILNGNDGTVKFQKTLNGGATPMWEVAIANVDNDNCAEIFFLGTDSRIYAYDCQLNYLWNTVTMPGNRDPINFGLADFDNDGKVELYCKDQIFDAHSGRRLVQTTFTPADWNTKLNGGPVAADMLGDSKLELVIGLSIYQVNIPVARTTDGGSLTLIQNRPEYFIRNEYNATSVADYNQDGFLDVVASGSTVGYNQNTTVFFWDVQNNTLKTYIDPDNAAAGNSYAPNGWKNGTGRINIADLDGDGQLNISYVSGKYLYALDENLNRNWRVVINEETSGHTGCTLFDFNGDGKSEIVYRDERYLYIIDGTNGSIYTQQTCISRTNREYPIVADVDADGSTELCITCGFDDVLSANNFNDLTYSRYSHVRVFKSATDPWVPARRLWNQHGYFVVNVNDDLTIPKVIQKHQLVFSQGSCTQGPNRPLNKFLNQAPYLDTQGCPVYASPDVSFVGSPPTVNPPTCPDLDFTISLDITNNGDVTLSGDMPLTFYTSNPFKPGATKLNTVIVSLNNLAAGQVFSATDLLVNGNGSDSLYIVLNDNGTQVAPIVLPTSPIIECNYLNNLLAVRVIPLPVSITASSLPKDGCSSTNNGSAQANVGGNTTDYNFYWFNGTTAGPIASADFVGSVYTAIDSGDYRVYAVHKTANCNSDTAAVYVDVLAPVIPAVTINVLSNQTTCNPPNGSLEAVVAGGNAGFSFQWEDSGAPIGVTGPLLINQPAGFYRVIVTSPGGCSSIATALIVDQTQEPTAVTSTTPITTCTNLTNGTLSAQATVSGVPQPSANYVFDWYYYDNATSTRGSILPAIHGTDGSPDRTGLPAGFYELVVTEIASGCFTNTTQIAEIADLTQTPTVRFTELQKQTSCDFTKPNGRLQADAVFNGAVQSPSNFTFEWFEGQNTLVTNQITGARLLGTNNQIADSLKASGQPYTVRIINIATGCQIVKDTIIGENIVVPVVALTPVDNGICDPAFSGGNLGGSVSATITFNGNAVTAPFTNYKFEWYNGSTTKPSPDYPTNVNSIQSLASGFYTLVVTRTDLGCAALPQVAEVRDVTVIPVITASATPATNCVPTLKNGGVEVTDVDNLGTPGSYTYEWFSGITTSGQLIASAPASLDTLKGGTGKFFTVLVTNSSTGCKNTATVEVPSNSTLPVISLGSTPNENCTGTPNGTAFLATLTDQGIAVPSPFAGYTFAWENGQTTSAISNMAPGNYSLKIRNAVTGCESDSVAVTVGSNLFIPPITIAITNQSSCEPTNLNGALAASIDETTIGGIANETNGYSYSWVNNGNPFAVPGVFVNSTSSISQRAGNVFYTVSVQRISTGCTNSKTVFLPEVISVPVVAAAVSSDVTRCDTPNGAIAANVGGAQIGYTFFWLNEVGNSQTADNNFILANADATNTDNGNYLNLIPGYYTVVARDNNTSCISQPVTREVRDLTANSTISLTLGPSLPSSCSANSGEMTATVSGGSPGGTFDLFWHTGGPINTDINFFSNPPQFDPVLDTLGITLTNVAKPALSNITDLYSGIYTLVVKDNGNGCGNYQTVFLPFINAHTINATPTPSTLCPTTSGNGTIAVSVSNILPPGVNDQNYTYKLYSGENPIAANLVNPPGLVGPGVPAPTYTSLAPGKYTIEVRQNPVVFGSNCPVYEVVEIESHALPPIVAVTATTADNSCDNILFSSGQATIEITKDLNDKTSGFTYDIDVSPAPFGWGGTIVRGPFPPSGLPLTETLTGLSSQTTVPQYTITVTSSNNCVTERLVSIQSQPLLPQILDGSVTTSPAIFCDPLLEVNAAAEVTTINVTGIGADNLNDYEFTWYTNAGLTTTIVNPTDGVQGAGKGGEVLSNVGVPLPLTTVVDGSYWVVARKEDAGVSGGVGCLSAPFKVDIANARENPSIHLSGNANTSCDTNFEGAIKIEVVDAGSVPSANYTYTFTTAVTSITPPPISNGDGLTGDDNFSALEDGLYIVTAVNNLSGCSTNGQITLQKTAVPIIIASATKEDQVICNPDGSIKVVDLTVGGVIDPVHTNFDFTWYENDPTTPPILTSVNGLDTLTVSEWATIGAGTYYVKAKRLTGVQPGSGCESAPLRVDLEDLSQDPTVVFNTANPNSSCDPSRPNGLILATASEQDATTDNYTFAWTLNGGALNPATIQTDASPTSQLADASEGDYVLQLVNTITGCTFTSGITLSLDQSLSLPNIVNISPTNPVNCFPTGSARVTEITIGNSTTYTNPPDDIDTDFDYEWYKGDTSPASILAGEQNSTLLNQLPDTYYALVIDRTTDCVSTFVEVVIDSADIVYPSIVIQQTAPQVSCNVAFGTGVLMATADGQTDANPNYSFTWYPSLDGTGSSFANTSTINGLFAGNYSVNVFNALTNCSASNLFILQSDSLDFAPQLSLTSGPLTECDSINGFVLARAVPFTNTALTYPFAYNYTADLYVGAPPANMASPEFPNLPNDPSNPLNTLNFLQINLPDSMYTVRITDNNTGCSTIGTIEVKDERVYPVPAVVTVAPVTNCDVLRPNGIASVSVNGDFTNYLFEWYEGPAVAGSPVYTGVEYNQLKQLPTVYAIQATHLTTGCIGVGQTSVTSNPVAILPPEIEVLSHITSCVENNGALRSYVLVNGIQNTKDFIFDWYDGTQEVPPPNFTGEIYDSLGANAADGNGYYSVTATSRATGCKSPLVTGIVEPRPAYPIINFIIEDATCNTNNGTATLVIQSEVQINNVEWRDWNNNVVGVGPNLTDVGAGQYTVIVTTLLGCEASKEIQIESEIRPYNGISRGSTLGQNDYFHIDCIENFTLQNGAEQDNRVQIFNRAGTLVYEAFGYDNENILFDGKSNKGISPMGTNLPDGTYFFIIDKRNGSKPVVGYLEIIH